MALPSLDLDGWELPRKNYFRERLNGQKYIHLSRLKEYLKIYIVTEKNRDKLKQMIEDIKKEEQN